MTGVHNLTLTTLLLKVLLEVIKIGVPVINNNNSHHNKIIIMVTIKDKITKLKVDSNTIQTLWMNGKIRWNLKSQTFYESLPLR